jgi:uncharacterized protein (TIGR03086 family)
MIRPAHTEHRSAWPPRLSPRREQWTRSVISRFGDFAGADYAAQLFLDTLIHGWDIARATGQDTTLDPELVAACLPIAQQITSMARSTGVFGEEVPVSPDADQQTKLLGLVGRRV